jgi:accessory colonization factor AcfC
MVIVLLWSAWQTCTRVKSTKVKATTLSNLHRTLKVVQKQKAESRTVTMWLEWLTAQ